MNKKYILMVACMTLPVLSLAHGFKALGFWGLKENE